MFQKISSITEKTREVRVIPTALHHPGGNSDQKPKPLHPAWRGQHRCYQPMISVQYGEMLILTRTDKKYRAEYRAIQQEPTAYRIDFHEQRLVDDVSTPAQAFGYRGYGKISSRNFPPLCPGEDPDPVELHVLDLHFIPFRSQGKFIPQCQVPEEK